MGFRSTGSILRSGKNCLLKEIMLPPVLQDDEGFGGSLSGKMNIHNTA